MEFAPSAGVVFERLAVTPDQIHELGLPTRPTKASDSRAKGFDGGSVEVDATPRRSCAAWSGTPSNSTWTATSCGLHARLRRPSAPC